jgi:2-keto-4-pentenoate hydratase
MQLAPELVESFGKALAHARRAGALVDLRLDRVMTEESAEAVQAAAIDAYGGAPIGYSIQATSALSRRQLGCDHPLFGPLLDDDVVQSGGQLRLPLGALGAGCSFAFAIGRPYPAEGEAIERESLASAVADCRLSIDVVGRRVPGSIPMNRLTATADFALVVAHVEGPHLERSAVVGLAESDVTAKINGSTVIAARGREVMGHPLEPAVWLARKLSTHGRRLEAGDLVVTGSAVGILQVMPGQLFEADFARLGGVRVAFE